MKSKEMTDMKLDDLPEDCIAQVLGLTSPRDACQLSLVSSAFLRAAEPDLLWEKFLPPDYKQILSKLASPLAFSSKKELFMRLSSPVLIDGGKKSFSLDKVTSKKCYTLSARELSITWSSNSLYWSWKPVLGSRFDEVAELILTWWLEIQGKLNTTTLSPNTTYGAYLIVKVANRAYGLDSIPSEVSVEVGNHQSRGIVYLSREQCRKPSPETNCIPNRVQALRSRFFKEKERIPVQREDGWSEIELGEFYNDDSDKEVKMCLKETKGEHLKAGLIVEGIELRPIVLTH